MDINFSEKRLLFKNPKGSKTPEVKAVSETTPKAPESKDAKKAKLEGQYKKAKDQITGSTKELMGNLRQNMTLEIFVKGIESVKQLRERISKAPIGLIEKIEDKYPGITLAAFTTHLKDADKLDLKNWSSDTIYSKFKEGTKYTVNFLGNQDAEDRWGLADMLDITMRQVTKYENGIEKFNRISIRRIGLKGQNKQKRGFYDEQGYMAIHTSDVFEFKYSNPEFKDMFRKKEGGKYKEIDADSYAKYASSKYAKEDAQFFDKQKTNWTFLSKKLPMKPEEILAIREKLGGLKGLSPEQRIKKVVEFIVKPENHIRARHCGNWVEKVYAIAGVKKMKILYKDLSYAFKGGKVENGWKPKTDPTRYDAKLTGTFASAPKLRKDLKIGQQLWVNNRNHSDYAGNHSVIFLGWVDKKGLKARTASWFGNASGKQKIRVYDFNKTPVIGIFERTEVDDELYYRKRQTQIRAVAPSESAKYVPDASKREMIERGSTPFAVRPGYRLSPDESRWYRSVRREAYRIAKLDINQRLQLLQERFQYKDALKYSAEMVGLKKKDWNFFVAMNDAVLRVESNYNTYCFNNRRRGGGYEVAHSTAAGEYQILNSVWKGAKKYTANTKMGRYQRRQMRRHGINPDMFMKLNIQDVPRPEFATPYQRTVVHSMFMFRYSRILKSLESVDNIYERIRTSSGRMRRSWMRALYLYWRNGPGGAAAFIRNLRKKKPIPLPETEAEMKEYYRNHLRSGDWQKRKGYKDFKTVMRVTQKFAGRMQQNLDQLGA